MATAATLGASSFKPTIIQSANPFQLNSTGGGTTTSSLSHETTQQKLNKDFSTRLQGLGLSDPKMLKNLSEGDALTNEQKQKIIQDEAIKTLLQLMAILNQYIAANTQSMQKNQAVSGPSPEASVSSPYPSNVLQLSPGFGSPPTGMYASPPVGSLTPTSAPTGAVANDGQLNLVSLNDKAKALGIPADASWEGRKLDSESAEAFLKANAEFRQKTGRNIRLESAYRDPARNKAAGGSETSNHLKGQAIDIAYADVDQAKDVLERNGLKQLGGTWNGKDERNHFSVTGA